MSKRGDYQVSFILRKCFDYGENTVSFGVIGGCVEIIDCVCGDATGDNVIDGLDIIRIKNYLTNFDYETATSTTEILPGADANGDGVIDGLDIIRLKKYIANYDYETGTSTVELGK